MVESLDQDVVVELIEVRKLILDRFLTSPASVAEMNNNGVCEWRVSDFWKERIVGFLQSLAGSESPAQESMGSDSIDSLRREFPVRHLS